MGFSEKLLMQDEKIEFQTKLKWQFAFGQSGGGLLLGSIVAWGFGWPTLGGFMMMWGLLCIPVEAINFLTSFFVITNRRVLIRTGLIKRRSLELLLTKVEAVGYEDGLLERINNSGHILITGTGGTKELLPHIANPLEFKKILQEKVELAQRKSA